jgi:hypothetical protein
MKVKEANLLRKQILYKYKIGDYLEETDYNLMLRILQNFYPDFEVLKKGDDVVNIRIIKKDVFKHSRYFELIYFDGNSDDIGTSNFSKPSEFTMMMMACRTAIRPIINEFRKKGGYKEGYHIHHNIPFSSTVFDWFYKQKKEDQNIILENVHQNEQDYIYFISEEIASDFCDYHQMYGGSLEAVSIEEHKKLHAKK